VLCLFCDGVTGVSHHSGGHGKCDGFDVWKRKKGCYEVFLLSLSYPLLFFFLHRKKCRR